ncbi:MAG: PQQ-binding-like beta-propeller repeat protein [Acidobacteria bacterium]|nr:PQQ-binding-like beta-propeller repeat protein [Acidobacteriota bacterium]
MRPIFLIRLPLTLLATIAAAAGPGAEGTVVWSHSLEGGMSGPPEFQSPWIATLTRTGSLVVLESGRARPLWVRELGSAATVGPRIADGRVLAATAAGTLSAWDLRTGDPAWSLDLPGVVGMAPGTDPEAVVLVAAEPGGLIWVDSATGEGSKRREVPGSPASAPVICGDRILVGTRDGRLFAFSAATREEVWERRCGLGPTGTPACSGASVLLGCDSFLYRIGLDRGRVHWRFRTGARVAARPGVRNGLVYFGSYDNNLYVLKHRNGHPVRVVSAGHRIHLDLLFLGDRLVLLPEAAADLLVHRLPDLEPIARLSLPGGPDLPCTAPVRLGAGLIGLGCGGDSPALHLLRIP